MKLEGGNLTIISLRKEDHGRYECQAENEVKTIVVGTDLIIQSTSGYFYLLSCELLSLS